MNPFKGRPKGRGVIRKPGVMNSWEKRYALCLEARQQLKEIQWFAFDAIKFRLAEKTFYTPDFLVMLDDGTIEVHEVKGFWEDDARVKIKVAADKFPFQFIGVTLKKGTWQFERF